MVDERNESREAADAPVRSWAARGAIRLLRWYSMKSPLKAGKWRVARAVNRLASKLPRGSVLNVRSRDGRQFSIDPTERQYHMGLLGFGEFEPGASFGDPQGRPAW